MLTDAANIIFETARRRCFTISAAAASRPREIIDMTEDEDAWDALNEAEGIQVSKKPGRPSWLPRGLDPELEELPKWDLLTQVLEEIEQEIIRGEATRKKGRK